MKIYGSGATAPCILNLSITLRLVIMTCCLKNNGLSDINGNTQVHRKNKFCNSGINIISGINKHTLLVCKGMIWLGM
jgi:hypothetical protein